MIPKLAKREKTIFIVCVAIIGASLIYNLMLEPFVIEWSRLNSQVRVAKLKLKKSEQILKKRIQIAEQYEDVAGYTAIKRATEEEEIAYLLSELEKLASQAGVRITDIKPKTAEELGYYRKYIVELEGEGDISQFSKFIFDIQNSPQLLSIKKLTFTMKGTTGGTLNGEMVITKLIP